MILRFPPEPALWSFFQLVGELERQAGPRAAPVGEVGPASAEVLRFRGVASLAFPPGDVIRIERRPAVAPERHDPAAFLPEERLALECSFLSLYGTASPLPVAYTERIVSTTVDRADLRDFLDLFNHRLVSLLFRSWRKYRAYAAIGPGGQDSFTQRMFALGGFADAKGQLPAPIEPIRLLPFVGLMRMRTRSAGTIAAVIGGYFRDVDARIEELVPRQVTLEDWQRNSLGQSSCSLGVDFVLGDRGTDHAGKIRLWLGPLDRARFKRFLPDGEDYRAVKALVAKLLPSPMEVELALRLAPGAAAPLQLGAAAEDAPLGWASWAGEDDSARTVTFPLV